jgi:hypothetical protein
VTGRILREPAFEHALLLLEDFVDAPETGESHGTGDGGANEGRDKEGTNRTNQSHNQENTPNSPTPTVFPFDYQRVKDANAGKHGCTYDNSIPVHISALNFGEQR